MSLLPAKCEQTSDPKKLRCWWQTSSNGFFKICIRDKDRQERSAHLSRRVSTAALGLIFGVFLNLKIIDITVDRRKTDHNIPNSYLRKQFHNLYFPSDALRHCLYGLWTRKRKSNKGLERWQSLCQQLQRASNHGAGEPSFAPLAANTNTFDIRNNNLIKLTVIACDNCTEQCLLCLSF